MARLFSCGHIKMIEQIFDADGIAHYKVTFPDGVIAWTNCCWMADLMQVRWAERRYAVNYRGECLNSSS